MDIHDKMRQAAGLAPRNEQEKQADRAYEQRREKEEFDADLKSCCRRHSLACSLSAEIERELNEMRLGPAEQSIIDEMQRNLITACQGVAASNPDHGRAAYETAVRQHVDDFVKQNPTVGGVMKNANGFIDRIVAGVVDAVMAAKEVVQGPTAATGSTASIGDKMRQAAGIAPTAKP